MHKKGGVLTDECTTNCASSAAAAGLQSPKGARQSKGTVGMVSDACITIDASLLLFSRTGPPINQVVLKNSNRAMVEPRLLFRGLYLVSSLS